MSDRRYDIQGLRALCVIGVCIYHAFPSVLGGGFVGVDAFFVISGFLITRNLVRELSETGRIDPFHFWARRAQRLLPNAILTLAAVLAASAVLLPAYRMEVVGGDLVSSALFYSNLRFSSRAVNYFESNDVISPVLHFWSLSLEEQFYFALPILLLLSWRLFPRRSFVAALLATLCAGSFFYSLHVIQFDSKAAFFLFPPRAWQLLAGGLVGICFERIPKYPQARAFLALVGAGAVVGSAVCYSDALIYPGLWALLPTLGAALILACAHNTWIGTALSVQPLRWIGDRSYSIYLWHWPFLAISAELWPDNLLAKSIAILGFISVSCLAFPVEDALRRAKFKSPTALRLVVAGVCIITFGLACQLISRRALLPEIAERANKIQSASRDFGRNYSDHCHLTADDVAQPPCIYGDKTSSKVIYLFGDSHAAMWFNPVVRAADKLGWKVIARTRSSCPSSVVSIWSTLLRAYYKNCNTWRSAVLREISEARPELVIISNSGNYYGWLYDRPSNHIFTPAEARTAWDRGVRSLIGSLPLTSHVIVIRDTPTQLKSYRDCLSQSDNCGRGREAALSQMEPIHASLLNSRIKLMDLTNRVCSKVWCPAVVDGKIIYQDDHHLTATFTDTLAAEFEEQLLAVRPQMSAGAGPPVTTKSR